jgi:hypothetical protein
MTTQRLNSWHALSIALTLLATASLNASVVEDFRHVGSGTLTWFGFTVYRATLLSPDGSYKPESPHALRIDYEFSFTKEQLAKSSLEQIEKIYGRQQDRESIIQQLESVFRDVEPGDHLLGIHSPGRGASFFSTQGLIGTLEDPQLARIFFDIWLAPGTSEPKLRSKLLGDSS